LAPISLEVENQIVSSLFQQAHEAFLYGFDHASIALCRSLLDHALKDKLCALRGKQQNLRIMRLDASLQEITVIIKE